MTSKQYVLEVIGTKDNKDRIEKLEGIYKTSFPDILRNIISAADESQFFDNDTRMLSFDEMVDAENDLHVEFSKLRIFPIMDCGENDFIVYHIDTKNWSMFNINDEISFKNRDLLEELL